MRYYAGNQCFGSSEKGQLRHGEYWICSPHPCIITQQVQVRPSQIIYGLYQVPLHSFSLRRSLDFVYTHIYWNALYYATEYDFLNQHMC